MKKLFLLLFSSALFAQTYTPVNYTTHKGIKNTGAIESNAHTQLTTRDSSTGQYGWITKANLIGEVLASLPPSTGYVPITGTQIGNPVTGDIDLEASLNLGLASGYSFIKTYSGYIEDDGVNVTISSENVLNLSSGGGAGGIINITGNINTPVIINAEETSRGITGSDDFSPNITDLDYTQKIYVDNSINNAVKEITSTSLLTLSGLIAINADNTKFDVPAGTGIIYHNGVRTNVSWNAFTAQTTPFIGVAPNTFIAINETGNLVLTQDLQDVTQMGEVIPLGYLEHVGTVIERVGTEPQYNVNLGTQWQQFLETFGNFVVEGFDVTATNLSLNVSAGTMFDNGLGYTQNIDAPNHYTASAVSTTNIRYYHRNGSGGWINNTAFTSNVNPNVYDDGTGTLASIPAGKYTIQRVTYYPPFGYLDVYYDQKYYNSKEEALAGYLSDTFEENPYLSYNLPIAIIVVKQGATNLNTTTDATIRKVSKSALGGSASLGSGEANTASNVGVGGVGVFKQKTGVNLEFKNINAGSNKVTVTNDTANNEIDVDVNEANFTNIPQSAISNLADSLNEKENLINAGTTSQYWRGDKTFQTLDNVAVGLSNVPNVNTTTTANITDSLNKRFVTDAQLSRVANPANYSTEGYVNTALYRQIKKLVSTNTADSNDVTNTATETTFTTNNSQFNLSSLEMRVGLQIIIEANLIMSTGSTGYTLNFRIKNGSAGTTNLHATGARTVSPSQTNVGAILRTTITILSLGATGTASVQMEYLAKEGAYVDGVIVPSNGVKTINTTVNNIFGISAQWSGASANNHVKIERINYYLQN